MKNNLGIYVHIPFCEKKCPYCDFYSLTPSGNIMDVYTRALTEEIASLSRLKGLVCSDIYSYNVDTLYFGGGTPSFFGSERLVRIINSLKSNFNIDKDAEITLECNPSSCSEKLFEKLAKHGINRISMGLQSAVDSERAVLGRSSSSADVQKAVAMAKSAGISNISLDLMLGVPKSSMESLKRSLDFCLDLDIKHISAYMLKIEKNTAFYLKTHELQLPEEDTVCDMYLHLCAELEKHGLRQYEISNFARTGYESRHNLKYWSCGEYLGLGPSAHSFIEKKRFYFDRDLTSFINGSRAIFDCYGASFEEYAMLRLRLTAGLSSVDTQRLYARPLPKQMAEKAAVLEKNGLAALKDGTISLSPQGFLISNTIINDLLT